MPARHLRLLLIGAVAVATGLVYVAHLESAPIYLNNDEAAFAVEAHAIASSGRDTNGRLLPVYFEVLEGVWFQPVLVYFMALFLTVLPVAEWSVRLPTVTVAIANVILTYAIARRLVRHDAAAIIAAALLAVMPAHFIHGRLACDYLYPLPFVLGWLLLLIEYAERGAAWRLVAAGVVLGLGFYTYIASVVMMPLYVALTYLALWQLRQRSWRPYAAITLGFGALLLPLVVWLIVHPDVYASFAGRYRAYGVDVLAPARFMASDHMAQRVAVFRSFFERTFLFERAESSVMSSTYLTGVFLKPMMVLMPLGVYRIIRSRRTPLTLLLLLGFLTSPVAASLVYEPHAIDRALAMLPFGVLIAAFGVEWMLSWRGTALTWVGRAACAALLVWGALQFDRFYKDYLTDYRARSAFWFNGNHRGAVEPIIRAHPRGSTRPIYLSAAMPLVHTHWKLYLIKHGREDLLAHTVFFDVDDLHLNAIPTGSILVTHWDSPDERALLKTTSVRAVEYIGEPDGSRTFTKFEKLPDPVASPPSTSTPPARRPDRVGS